MNFETAFVGIYCVGLGSGLLAWVGGLKLRAMRAATRKRAAEAGGRLDFQSLAGICRLRRADGPTPCLWPDCDCERIKLKLHARPLDLDAIGHALRAREMEFGE